MAATAIRRSGRSRPTLQRLQEILDEVLALTDSRQGMNEASLPIGSAGSTGCACAAFLAIQIPQHGLDPPQAASNRSPALDQFPPSVPDPPLSNFHASPPTFAICF
jgi:hypothetical protein